MAAEPEKPTCLGVLAESQKLLIGPCTSWQCPQCSPWSITLACLMWELLEQGVAVQCWRTATCPGAQSQVLFLSHSQQ